jgi:type IV pilus assembly protein PilC
MSRSLKSYQWEGITPLGEHKQGIIQSETSASVKTELRKRGIITRQVRRISPRFRHRYQRTIKSVDITSFTRQLSTLLKSGIPMLQSCALLEKSQPPGHRMIALLSQIQTDLKSGLMLTHILQKYPKLFSPLYCSMIHAGEQSGSLDCLLDTLSIHLENRETIKKKIKKALTYPIAITIIAILITVGLLIVVIPQFQTLFSDFGATLPAFTQALITLSVFLNTHGVLMILFVIISLSGLVQVYRCSKLFAERTHQLLLRLPIIGTLIHKSAVARFSRVLSITLAAGLPLTNALKEVSSVTGNPCYGKATLQIKEDISKGLSLRLALENTQLFPNLAIHLLGLGEDSGALEEMLTKTAELYEEELEYALDTLSSFLEPTIMALLGLLIGSLVLALYLPILKLGTVL